MLKKDLLEKIKDAKDDEDINSLLAGTDVEEEFKTSGLTLDAVKNKIKTDKDFKAFLESENDKHFDKALDTWKKNNLEKELEPFIKEKYPDLVTDPTQKKLLELEKQLEAERAANARKDLLAEAIKYAADKKLPSSIVEKCLDEDFDKTKEVIDSIAEDWSKGLESLTTEKMKSNSYIPGKGSDGKPISIGAAIAAQANGNKVEGAPNPWGNDK
ncbi:DUF4355 domain-containing protein [Clostridium brassicae]|uniref:DUF4355 domain-containing protein n=1 Tax=Clostridium brassicae TaxID=2999072 RepID=A0ABT4D973_9CLOT|nr:DUF4355 domain-containing protein [Clostridium brassicae]MCY6958859.1 DUF4355 domain-containing protein [Clostridium brassicae]